MKFSLLLFFLLYTQAWAKWSVSTYNIRNFDQDRSSGRTNLAEFEQILLSMKSDVIAFQEVVNVSAFKSFISKVLPDYSVRLSNCGGSGKQNLAVVYRTKLFKFVSQTEDLNFSTFGSAVCGSLRPVLLVTLKLIENSQNYVFGVVHLKAGSNDRAFSQRWEQYELLSKLTRKYEDEKLILLGDFNTTGYVLKDRDFVKFEDFLADARFVSTTEAINCTNYWRGTLGGADYQPSVLDHIVIPADLASSVASTEVGAHCAQQDCQPATPQELGVSYQSVSDHCPVKVTFR